jgi:hypothetical protein
MNIPETNEEWIKYGNKMIAAKKREKPVVEIDLVEIEKMWDYEYQAKLMSRIDGHLITVLASDSLNNLKSTIKRKRWPHAILTTSNGVFSSGQNAVDEYRYIPKY